MALFKPAFDEMLKNEGGFKLTNISGDRGGRTYAGISENFHPNWSGWEIIDNGAINSAELEDCVYDFYKHEFWDRVKGDEITDQHAAMSIFDFAVNAGVSAASRLAQRVIGAVADGIIGKNTISKLNRYDSDLFIAKYAISKIKRYAEIVKNDSTQRKFLLGWINRAIKQYDL